MLQAERRKRDVRNRLRRATWTVRENLGDFIEGFPCNVIGHHWKHVPPALLSARARARGTMHFKCTRCFLMSGATAGPES
jgi:hypothetical protein